jgi:hypothetical protein
MSFPIILANVIQPAPNYTFKGWDPISFGGSPGDSFPSGLVVSSVYFGAITYKMTSAQLLALPGTKVQILPPPPTPGLAPYLTGVPKGFGTAFALSPTALWSQYQFGGTAYTVGNVDNKFQLEYTGQATALIQTAANGLVTAAVNTVSSNTPVVVGPNIAQTALANLGVEMTLVGTTPALTLGNGTVVWILQYDLLILQ